MHDDPEQPDLSIFADEVTTSLRAGGVVGNIAYDRASERLINETLPEAFYLLEPWRVWQRLEEAERAAWLGRYVEVFLRGRQVPRTWEEAREGILPRVRPRVVHVCWPLRHELDGLRVPRLPFGELTEHLVVELAWPQEDAVATVLMEDLERWGVTPDAALEAAASVLRTRSEKPAAWLGSKELAGVWRSPWQDRFDASRVLFGGGLRPRPRGPARGRRARRRLPARGRRGRRGGPLQPRPRGAARDRPAGLVPLAPPAATRGADLDPLAAPTRARRLRAPSSSCTR